MSATRNPWAAVQHMIDAALAVRCPYGIDDVYVTFSNTEPTTRWPETSWERITDCFLRAADDGHKAGTTGGAWEHTQTLEEMVPHNHHWNKWYYVAGDHADGVAGGNGKSAVTSWTEMSMQKDGGGKPMDITNKYTAVYMWRRTA